MRYLLCKVKDWLTVSNRISSTMILKRKNKTRRTNKPERAEPAERHDSWSPNLARGRQMKRAATAPLGAVAASTTHTKKKSRQTYRQVEKQIYIQTDRLTVRQAGWMWKMEVFEQFCLPNVMMDTYEANVWMIQTILKIQSSRSPKKNLWLRFKQLYF